MLKHVESVVLFVPDVGAAARWYAALFGVDVRWENPQYAFICAPGVTVGFHPSDAKCPGGAGGSTVYWEVENLAEAMKFLLERGATPYRGPAVTSFGADVAMLKDPFGCTLGLNASTLESRARVNAAGPTTEPTSKGGFFALVFTMIWLPMTSTSASLQRLTDIGFRECGRWRLDGNRLRLDLHAHQRAVNVLYCFAAEGRVLCVGKTRFRA